MELGSYSATLHMSCLKPVGFENQAKGSMSSADA